MQKRFRDECRERTLWPGGKVATQQAALVNGAASHALDYDDVHTMMSGHPTVPVLPALLALAEWQGRGGRDLIAARPQTIHRRRRAGVAGRPVHAEDRCYHPVDVRVGGSVERIDAEHIRGALAARHQSGCDDLKRPSSSLGRSVSA